MQYLRWLRAGLLLVGSVSCLWIVYLYFGGNGTLELSYNFNGSEGAISRFQPHGRALDLEQNQDNGETYQRLVGEPTYFTVTLPSAYEEIDVSLEYQNPNQTLVELGIKQTTNTELFDYRMQPLENQLVDASDWQRIENDQYVLLQKTPLYHSVEEFLNSPPLDAHVGTYLNAPTPNFVDPSYIANLELDSDITVTLRGKHNFYSYAAAGESMQFAVTLDTINYVAGTDVATISLWQGDAMIDQAMVTDRGVAELEAIAQLTGVYKLTVDASDDFLITNVHSTQERLVAGSLLHLAGSPEYLNTGVTINTNPTVVTSDANWVTFIAKHPYGTGSYVMYNQDFPVNKVDAPFTWINPIADYPFSFTATQNDLYLQSDSYFVLPGAVAFDPWFGFRPISRYSDADHLDYVLSGIYHEPTRLRGWTTATAHFDLESVTQERPNTLQFILSAPGLEETVEGLKVRSIVITAKQPPLNFSYVWEKLFGAN